MHESVGEVLKDLTEMYDSGKIDGIYVIVNRADNTDVWFSCANFNYLERLGIAEFLRSESVARMLNKNEDI